MASPAMRGEDAELADCARTRVYNVRAKKQWWPTRGKVTSCRPPTKEGTTKERLPNGPFHLRQGR